MQKFVQCIMTCEAMRSAYGMTTRTTHKSAGETSRAARPRPVGFGVPDVKQPGGVNLREGLRGKRSAKLAGTPPCYQPRYRGASSVCKLAGVYACATATLAVPIADPTWEASPPLDDAKIACCVGWQSAHLRAPRSPPTVRSRTVAAQNSLGGLL